MAPSTAATVEQYLASLPADRRAALARVRAAINARLPAGYEETMQYGMISWIVPRSRLAATYNGQPLSLASLASQKQHMALYLMSVYGDAKLSAWFRDAFRAAGKKLDMGKSCVRFKAIDALPLDVIGEAISRVSVDAYVAAYEASRSKTVKPKAVAERPAARSAKRGAAKRATTKRSTAKRATMKRATMKRATTKRATTKRATTKRSAAKRATTTKRTTTKRATTTKRGAAKRR